MTTRDDLLRAIGQVDLEWTNRVAESVPVDPHGRSVKNSDYNVHHHEISATGEQESAQIKAMRAVLQSATQTRGEKQ